MAAKSCTGCSASEQSVPYIVHESAMARGEREKKRLCIIIIILIALLFLSNLAWIVYEAQFETEYVTETYEADANEGGNAVINEGGDVNINGESAENNKN